MVDNFVTHEEKVLFSEEYLLKSNLDAVKHQKNLPYISKAEGMQIVIVSLECNLLLC